MFVAFEHRVSTTKSPSDLNVLKAICHLVTYPGQKMQTLTSQLLDECSLCHQLKFEARNLCILNMFSAFDMHLNAIVQDMRKDETLHTVVITKPKKTNPKKPKNTKH